MLVCPQAALPPKRTNKTQQKNTWKGGLVERLHGARHALAVHVDLVLAPKGLDGVGGARRHVGVLEVEVLLEDGQV